MNFDVESFREQSCPVNCKFENHEVGLKMTAYFMGNMVFQCVGVNNLECRQKLEDWIERDFVYLDGEQPSEE